MKNIAILGFGVVGSGVAKLITDNGKEVSSLAGTDKVNIKYILDLRDFPDSPFADKIVHNYDVILNDKEIDAVIEVMGGSHPAYEFTTAALKAGKSVITSNKEVVASYGDEFLRLAEENGVSYRFEAAVGGGIPVISPMINCIGQNKIKEVRGILNGTTNYILTKMFVFGEKFEDALKDAQAKGYAERNPDADVLGLDACRKIVILAALATGNLISPELVHTEGITSIRARDVKGAESLGSTIKLVGRCIAEENKDPFVIVAPFMIPDGEPLSGVSGVYNAVEIIGEPIGNVMFYGRGAGAGATASAVVGDVCQALRGSSCVASPRFERNEKIRPVSEFSAKRYIVLDGSLEGKISSAFGEVKVVSRSDEVAFLTEHMTEAEVNSALESIGATPIAHIRTLF